MSTAPKEERVETMRELIAETHDMAQVGQVWSWEACGVSGRDVCTICGLTHRWGRRGQNTGSYDSWETADGEQLTLAQASRLDCE